MELDIELLQKEHPILKEMISLEPVTWLNPHKKAFSEMPHFTFDRSDMEEAEELWNRFAPFFKRVFPETVSTNGVIESELRAIPQMKAALEKSGVAFEGDLYLKSLPSDKNTKYFH